MDTPIVVSVVAAASGVIVTAVSYYLTKKKERDADWRKYKFEQYKEFLLSVSGTVGTDSTPEGNRNFAKACNTLHLIVALHAYQDEVRISNPSHSDIEHDARLSKLVWEIRKDVGIPGTPDEGEFSVHLWCSGTNQQE